MVFTRILGLGAGAVALASGNGAVPPDPANVFADAKRAWRSQVEVPYVRFSLRERYEWRNRVHDSWWDVSFRTRDHALALRRIVVAADESDRLRGTPIVLSIRTHRHAAVADTLDTNAAADAFPVLDPMIEPAHSFGLVRHEVRAALGAASPGPSPTPTAQAGDIPSPRATAEALREIAHVEATARDYAISFVGIERVRGVETVHLSLEPLHDPQINRLRDLWVNTQTSATVRLTVAGLFSGRPYADARWTVDYTEIEGRTYLQQIRADEPLRFGVDRFVSNLQFDFVGYAFPATIEPYAFERML